MNVRALFLPVAFVAAAQLIGCQAQQSGPTESSTARARRASPRISDEILAQHGLQTLWYNGPDRGEHKVFNAWVLDEALFVATQPVSGKPGKLKSINKKDGMPNWYYEIGAPLQHAPSVYRYATLGPGSDHEVYISLDDTVHCIGLEHGQLLWKKTAPYGVSTQVVADADRYFAGSESGQIFAARKDSAVVDWQHRTGAYVEADPVIAGTSLFAGSTDGVLYALSRTAGYYQGSSWQFPTGARITASPVVFSQWVLAGSADYKLYCLSASNGTKLWDFLAEAPILESPVVYSFRPNQEFAFCIGVDSDRGREVRTLFAVRLRGRRGERGGIDEWRFEGVSRVVSLGAKNLYVLSDASTTGDRAIVALDVLSGEERFRVPVDPGFLFVPTNGADFGRNRAERGRIYLVGHDGTIQTIAEK